MNYEVAVTASSSLIKRKPSILSDLFSDWVSRPHLESDLFPEQITTEKNGFREARVHLLLDVCLTQFTQCWILASRIRTFCLLLPLRLLSAVANPVLISSHSACLNLCFACPQLAFASVLPSHLWAPGPGQSLPCEDSGGTVSLKQPNPAFVINEEELAKVQWACNCSHEGIRFLIMYTNFIFLITYTSFRNHRQYSDSKRGRTFQSQDIQAKHIPQKRVFPPKAGLCSYLLLCLQCHPMP